MTINTNMYAQALYEAGLEADPLKYMEELDLFNALLSSDEDVRQFFFKTYDNFNNVKEILEEIFTQSFVNFIELLYNARLLYRIDEISERYEQLLMEDQKLSLVSIKSQKELDDQTINKILEMIKQKYPQPFRINTSVDEDLLGGYILKVNKDVYDTSLRSRLMKIKNLEV